MYCLECARAGARDEAGGHEDPIHVLAALKRLGNTGDVGARRLFYGPLNAVVHPDIVQAWLDSILPFEPGHQSERVSWLFCLAQLARQSGQRALDVDLGHRTRVLAVPTGQFSAAESSW